MLANQGLYLGAAIPLVGAIIDAQQREVAHALFGLTLATCIYTPVTVPLLTPARQRAYKPASARGAANRNRFCRDLTSSIEAQHPVTTTPGPRAFAVMNLRGPHLSRVWPIPKDRFGKANGEERT